MALFSLYWLITHLVAHNVSISGTALSLVLCRAMPERILSFPEASPSALFSHNSFRKKTPRKQCKEALPGSSGRRPQGWESVLSEYPREASQKVFSPGYQSDWASRMKLWGWIETVCYLTGFPGPRTRQHQVGISLRNFLGFLFNARVVPSPAGFSVSSCCSSLPQTVMKCTHIGAPRQET